MPFLVFGVGLVGSTFLALGLRIPPSVERDPGGPVEVLAFERALFLQAVLGHQLSSAAVSERSVGYADPAIESS